MPTSGLDNHSQRAGELPLQKNSQAKWRAGVVAAVAAAGLVPMWLIALDRLVPLHWGLFPPHYPTNIKIGLVSAALATVIALAVARKRQPHGACIRWDAWGITEVDGGGARVAIPWREATVAVRCDTGGESMALAMLHRVHLSGFAPDASVIGLTLRIRGAHGREIWVTEGVQTPALAGRMTTVANIGPLLLAIKGVPIVPMGSGHPGENLLALFYIFAIAGYVGAAIGLAILVTEHTTLAYVPLCLGISIAGLALRPILPYVHYRRLAAQERKLRGARHVQLVANDGTLLTAEDDQKKRTVIDTTTLAHLDGRLHERRGGAFMVQDPAGKVVALETAAVRGTRLIYQRALALELVLRALLVVPVLAVLALFHARVTVDRPWTILAGPYSQFDTQSTLLADASHALIATRTSPGVDVTLFDLHAGTELDSLNLEGKNTIRALALAPDHTWALVSRGYDTVVWTISERYSTPRGSLATTRGVVVAAVAPDGARLLTGSADGRVSVWDPATFESIHTFADHTGEILALAFSPDGALAVSGGADGTARLLDLEGNTPGAVLTGHGDRVQAVAILPDAIVTGADDGAVRFFSKAGDLARTVPAHPGGVTAIGLHRDGAFATAGANHLIRVWDPDWQREGSEELERFDMHTDERVRNAGTIKSLAFSSIQPDLLVLTSHGMLLRVDLTGTTQEP